MGKKYRKESSEGKQVYAYVAMAHPYYQYIDTASLAGGGILDVPVDFDCPVCLAVYRSQLPDWCFRGVCVRSSR